MTRKKGCPKMTELKETHKDTQHTTATWTRRHARQRQLQQLERQRRACSGASRTASSNHGSSRPERPRLGASVDGEARQRRHATWISATLSSRSSRAVTSYTSCSGRWQRRQVTSRRPPNNVYTANGSKLCRTSLRAQIVSTT